MASFRDRLVATIHAAGPVLELPDIMVIGSEVILEKLVTDRTGEKGERDLLVALGLIALAGAGDLDAVGTPERHARSRAASSEGGGASRSTGASRGGRSMNAAFERRLRDHRRRLLIRAWQYRQRDHAHGVWFRLRRTLAAAERLYVISAEDARMLLAEGSRRSRLVESSSRTR